MLEWREGHLVSDESGRKRWKTDGVITAAAAATCKQRLVLYVAPMTVHTLRQAPVSIDIDYSK